MLGKGVSVSFRKEIGMVVFSSLKRFFIFLAALLLPYASAFGWANNIRWHPAKNIVAVQTNLAMGQGWSSQNVILIYSVSPLGQLSLITTLPTGSGCNDIRWSPNGLYLAVAFSYANAPRGGLAGFMNDNSTFNNELYPGPNDEVRIYRFNGLALSPLTSVGFSDNINNGAVTALTWRPDSAALIVGGYGAVNGVGGFSNTNNVRLYTFNGSTLTAYGSAFSSSVGDVRLAWSPDSDYIAVGWDNYFAVCYAASLFTVAYSPTVPFTHCYDIHWEPASNYMIAVSGYSSSAVATKIYSVKKAILARFGVLEDKNKYSFVTDIVNADIASAISSITATTALFGDPAPGEVKQLEITFGDSSVQTCDEGSSITFPTPFLASLYDFTGDRTGAYNTWAEFGSNYILASAGNGSYGQGGLNTNDPIRMYYTGGAGVPFTDPAPDSKQISAANDGWNYSDARVVTFNSNKSFVATGSTSSVQTTNPDAAGFSNNADFRIYSVNGKIFFPQASRQYGSDTNHGQVYTTAFSPDGQYLAVGGTNPLSGGYQVTGFSDNNEVRIYKFDGFTLVPFTSVKYGAAVYTVAWDTSGTYLAVGGTAPLYGEGGFNDTNEVRIYSINSFGLTPITSMRYGEVVKSLAWRPSGTYLVIAGCDPTYGAGGFNDVNEVRIASFNGNALTAVTSAKYGTGTTTVNCVAWRPDSNYLGIIGNYDGAGNNLINILGFNGSALTSVTSVPRYSSGSVSETYGYSIAWAINGLFAVGGAAISNAGNVTDNNFKEVRVYSFDGSSISYCDGVVLGTKANDLSHTAVAESVAWTNFSSDYYFLGCAGHCEVDQSYNCYSWYVPSSSGTIMPDVGNSFSAKYGIGHTVCYRPGSKIYLAVGGQNGIDDLINSGFSNTDQLRVYKQIGINTPNAWNKLISLSSQDYGNSIDTTDANRPEHGLGVVIPSLYTLVAGEHIKGNVDLPVGLISQTTQSPIPTIATTQSLHDGDLDLTAGCIQLNGSLKLGPGSNITTVSQAAPLGSIYLNNQTLFLLGDTTLSTTITEFQTCVRLQSPGTIDGLGNKLSISGPVILTTNGATSLNRHIFKNLTFTNLWNFSANGDWNPFYDDSGQGVIFDSVTFLTQPGQTVTLAVPSITIRGTCNVIGGGTFTLYPYGATNPSINIESGAEFYVGQGTTLKVYAVSFEDSTATLFLDGANLMNVRSSGNLDLLGGTLKYNGLVTMSALYGSRFAVGDGTVANDLHIVGEPAATLKFDQIAGCAGESTMWYRNVH